VQDKLEHLIDKHMRTLGKGLKSSP